MFELEVLQVEVFEVEELEVEVLEAEVFEVEVFGVAVVIFIRFRSGRNCYHCNRIFSSREVPMAMHTRKGGQCPPPPPRSPAHTSLAHRDPWIDREEQEYQKRPPPPPSRLRWSSKPTEARQPLGGRLLRRQRETRGKGKSAKNARPPLPPSPP